MSSGLTQGQRRALFAAIREAARGLGEEPEAYRRRVMAEELGSGHLSEVSRTAGHDRLMARVRRDAGDYEGAVRHALAPSARLRRLVTEAAEALAPGNALGYVAGVMIRSRTVRGCDQSTLAARLASESGWLDIPESQLRRVLAMLKTRCIVPRGLRKRIKIPGISLDGAGPGAYDEVVPSTVPDAGDRAYARTHLPEVAAGGFVLKSVTNLGCAATSTTAL